jgi:UDP-3-O-[3-hydroxymyristoyl] glucosamine N-acyltransferase
MAAVRLADVAVRLGARLEGDGTFEVRGFRSLEEAGPADLSFVADPRQAARLATSRAGALILPEGIPAPDRPVLRTANPSLSLARALTLLYPVEARPAGIHATAVVAPEARVDDTASVGPLCVVEAGAVIGPRTVLMAQVFVGRDARLGADCRLYPQVVLREGTELGDRVTLQSGAVLGADGFGYARDGRRYEKIPQVGRVVIEDDVEIGANACVDRATLGETRIGRGSKIDNLVQLAHNVRVGEDTIIVALVGVSGSARIGSRVTLAGQVGVANHVRIGDDVIVGAQAGVTKEIPEGSIYLGSPAIPHGEFKRQLATMAVLPAMRKALKALESRLASLEARLGGGRPEA